jgi:hypothetical protein
MFDLLLPMIDEQRPKLSYLLGPGQGGSKPPDRRGRWICR